MTAEADARFMAEALALAEAAGRAGEVPVGAVLVLNDEIIGRAGNGPIGLSDPTAHAEILTLRAAGAQLCNYRLVDSTLFVTLEPCPMCAAALVHARVARVVYGAPDPKAGACGSIMNLAQDPRLNHRVEVDGGVLAAESAALLKHFFQARR
jgi:tRNA(adenine34) deaminase